MNNFNDGGFKKGRKDFGGRPKFGGDRSHGGGNRGGGNHGGGGNRGGGNRGGGNRGGGSSEMFPATCTSCNKSCQVPFQPSGDKPVYCSACFERKGNDDNRGGGFRREERSERPDYTKLPRDQRPPRHDASRGKQDDGLAEIKQKLATIESRLNRILDLINPPTPPTKAVSEEKTPETKKAVKKAVKKVTEKKVVKKKATPKVVKKKPVAAKKVVKKAVKKTVKKAKK